MKKTAPFSFKTFVLQTGNPSIQTPFRKVTFIHFIQRQADKFAIDNRRGSIERITTESCPSDKLATCILQIRINGAKGITKGVAKRRRVATAKKSDQLAR